MTRSAVRLALGAAIVLAGCAQTRPAAPPPASAAAAPLYSEFERAQLAQAEQQEQAGDLARAALSWEVLTLLRPEQRSYPIRLAQVQRLIEAGVADAWQQARQAERRGELERASQLYLSVLALQPRHVEAAQALRAIERERNRRGPLAKTVRPSTSMPGLAPQAYAPAASAPEPRPSPR